MSKIPEGYHILADKQLRYQGNAVAHCRHCNSVALQHREYVSCSYYHDDYLLCNCEISGKISTLRREKFTLEQKLNSVTKELEDLVTQDSVEIREEDFLSKVEIYRKVCGIPYERMREIFNLNKGE